MQFCVLAAPDFVSCPFVEYDFTAVCAPIIIIITSKPTNETGCTVDVGGGVNELLWLWRVQLVSQDSFVCLRLCFEPPCAERHCLVRRTCAPCLLCRVSISTSFSVAFALWPLSSVLCPPAGALLGV